MRIVFLLFFLSKLAVADTRVDVANCAAVESDADRLICFDELASKMGVDKPVIAVAQGAGKWKVRTDKSPIDDSTNVYLSLDANEEIKSMWNKVTPKLYIRCAENKTNLFITWDVYLGIDTTDMLIRFDKQKAEKNEWYISTDTKAVFAKRGHIGLTKRIMEHQKMLAQITPYGESPVMVTFNVAGLQEAIKPLRKECSW